MNRSAIIELHRDALRFSAGHLMLLSADERETLHGHDYQVSVALETHPGPNGFAVDLRQYRDILQALCEQLDFRFLIPGRSPYLQLGETNTHCHIQFKDQTVSFPKTDVNILPVHNITLEELSSWFLQQLTQDPVSLKNQGIMGIQVKVSNGRCESAASSWSVKENMLNNNAIIETLTK